jgi:hypothetical protein
LNQVVNAAKKHDSGWFFVWIFLDTEDTNECMNVYVKGKKLIQKNALSTTKQFEDAFAAQLYAFMYYYDSFK